MDITFENLDGNSTTKCGCSQSPLDCPNESGCPINLNLLCTFYDGEELPELKIYKGMTGQEVLVAINTYLLDIINNLDIKPTVLKSVGEGHVIYKGLSPHLFHEIKSLITDESLVVEEQEDELKISLNSSYIEDLVNTLVSQNSTVTMEYKYSSTLLNPGSPETGGTWSNTYSQEAEWMAFREILNTIPSPWKVIKIKGNPGRDGVDGRDGRDGRDGIDAIGINGISSITSIVFKRSTTKPAKPTGGTYQAPVPANWSDGIPAENGNPVWMSKAVIYNGLQNPQTPQWTEPSLIADTATLDFEWTNYIGTDPGTPDNPLNGATWSNSPTESSTWMAMAEILNGVKQPWKIIKIKGEEGNISSTINIFKRSATKPTAPTGGTFSNPFPSGWYDGIPQENGNPAWLSTRIFSSNGGYPQQDYWSEPTKIIDTSVVDYEFSSFNGESPGTPSSPLNGATWHNEATVDDIWMAVSQISNGVRGPWSVAKIKGEGSPGQGVYKSIVFKRSSDNSPITSKPTGGTFFNPIPSDWSDGIPSGVGAVYQSSRLFTSDGQAPQEEEWGTPILAVDNEFKDYAYSSLTNKPAEPLNTQGPIQDDAVWHNDPTENDIWQAVRDVRNGVYGDWTIQKIKGEQGPRGETGSGFMVVSSNPMQSVAVGGDNTTSSVLSYLVSFSVYNNSTQLFPTNNSVLTDDQYRVELPTSPHPGVTIVKETSSTLRFNIASGTVFPENSIVSLIDIPVGPTNIILKSSFTIVPIKTAEDATSLSLSVDSNVVKYDAFGNLVTPTTITATAVQQNYTETITWSSLPVGIVSGTGTLKTLNTAELFTAGNTSVKIKVVTPNGLSDETTIVKVVDGAPGTPGSQGAPGINGTSGPTPRLLELVNGGQYENGQDFIDYAYYRSNDVNEGWYTVKVVGRARTVVTYTGGLPDTSPTGSWVKAPFTKEMSFGTVVAEQANFAGFIFRNRTLNSQDVSYQSCTTTNDRGPFPNLSLDGKQGIIKFLEKMFLTKDGIAIKDDCGRNRMVFMFENGVPVLKFFNETGVIIWEAGENNFGGVTTAFFSPQIGFKTSIPVGDTPPTSTTPISEVLPYIITVNNQYRVNENNPITNIYGQKYVKMNPEVPTIPEHNKIFMSNSTSSGFVEDGWYIYLVDNGKFWSSQGFRVGVVVYFAKIVGGAITQYESRNYKLASTKVYRAYSTDLYGGSGDDLYVTWVDKDGNSQAYSERGSGTGNWMSYYVCAEEGSFNTNGSIIEGDIC